VPGYSTKHRDQEGASVEATVHRPGEGEHIGGPTAVTIKATGEETSGSFYLGEVVLAPGFPGPPPHIHVKLHDMFYVLDGTLTMRLGDEAIELSTGSSSAFPPVWSTLSATRARPRFAS
jgi:quercetin dioxygenase-like cupin family protein